MAHVKNNSGAFEWYTPRQFTAAARFVMGGIDLDPASCEQANEWIRADRIYTIENSGLGKEWTGRVFLNPPYAKGLIYQFCDQLAECSAEAWISLTNNATETAWFQTLAGAADAFCFVKGRIKYISPDGVKNTPLQGQAFLYRGPDHDRFIRAFSVFGVCGRFDHG